MKETFKSPPEPPNPEKADDPQLTAGFIRSVAEELRQGYGFLPLIGAGFSAPSGAPLIKEMSEYLQRCISISFGLDAGEARYREVEPWNPRTDQWPPFIDRSRVYPSGYWSDLMFERIAEVRRQNRDTGVWNPETTLLGEGYGAMQEWRTALLFLSRLERSPRRPKRPEAGSAAPALRLGTPRQEVIDACFREVLRAKYPTLGHSMLAALSGALRLDVILTINFDDLLERAFDIARYPLEVFEVPLEGKLPDWNMVSSVRALVKLHGGRSSLRADYSLDEEPSEEDKARFLSYILSASGRATWTTEQAAGRGAQDLPNRNHLLVMGFSGKDRRIKAFIKYAWKRLGSRFKIFWICFSKDDVDDVIAFVNEESEGDWTKTHVLRHTNSGLLLLEMYQTLRKNLPPLGSIFPSVSRLTLPPLEPEHIKEELKEKRKPQVDLFKERLRGALKDFDGDEGPGHKVVVVSSRPDVSGITSVCARAFRELEKEKVCLWIDMNDITSADNLFEVLLESIYYRLGFEDWIPSTLGDRTRETPPIFDRRGREIDRLLRSLNKRWVVFLNAFETPGANTLDEQEPRGNGWLCKYDPPEPNTSSDFSDGSANARDLIRLFGCLCGPTSRLSVVLMCRERDVLSQGESAERLDAVNVDLEASHPPGQFFVEESIVLKALEWTLEVEEQKDARRRFLHGLVLMQRPRLLATLWSTALTPFPEPESDSSRCIAWIDGLEKTGLVRRKPGGLVWIHLTCRQMLRQTLVGPKGREAIASIEPAKREDDLRRLERVFEGWNPTDQEAEIHKELGEWYEHVLDASDAPAAAFEAAFHFCKAAVAFLGESKPKYGRAEANVDAAAALLRSCSFLIQTHGYSRGSCRRLEFIAEKGTEVMEKLLTAREREEKKKEKRLEKPTEQREPDVEASVRRLWIVCAEIMRAVAREVGEDAKAYYRHRQVGRLMAGGATWCEVSNDGKAGSITQALRERLVVPRRDDEPKGDERLAPPAEWTRWRRWCGMLAIASRSYRMAEEIFEAELGPGEAQGRDFSEQNPRLIFAEQRQRIETLRMIEQAVELLLLRSHVGLRTKRLTGRSAEGRLVEKRLAQADALIKRGGKLARKIRDCDRTSDSHEIVAANWCESRLLMHQSVVDCRSKIIAAKVASEAPDSMGILGDAEAKQRLSDIRRSRSELAMIDLHRADARICEAEATRVAIEDLGPSGLNDIADKLRRGEDFKNIVPLQPAEAHKASALLTDGLRALDSAEPVLRDRRRNVWWTTWYFERKLRSIALSILVMADETETPIPFLGLEAAMRATETEADRLLNAAVRMIRVDAYRLATIIDAYKLCLLALEFRLWKEYGDEEYGDDSKKWPLPIRRTQMLVLLRDALRALDETFKRRMANFNAPDEKGAIDGDVGEYVGAVIKDVRRHLEAAEDALSARDRERVMGLVRESIAKGNPRLSYPETIRQAEQALADSGKRESLPWQTFAVHTGRDAAGLKALFALLPARPGRRRVRKRS